MVAKFELLTLLGHLPDDCLVGVTEVSALTGFAESTVRQRKLTGFPPTAGGTRRLRWNLGDVRAWTRGQRWSVISTPQSEPRRTRLFPRKPSR